MASQHEKARDIDFTLNCYCTAPFRLYHTPVPPQHTIEQRGTWDKSNAGGALGKPTFVTNPMWSLALRTKTRLHIELLAPKQYSAGIQLVRGPKGGKRLDSIMSGEEAMSSGDYRSGFCYAEADALEPGVYTLVASTFKPGQVGPFSLKVCSSVPLQHLRTIPAEGHGMAEYKLEGRWDTRDLTAAGCANHGNFSGNPQFKVQVKVRSQFLARLSTPQAQYAQPAMNLTLFWASQDLNGPVVGMLPHNATPRGGNSIATSNRGVYTDALCGPAVGPIKLEPGTYVLVPSTYEPWVGDFQISAHSHPPASFSRVN